MLFSLLILAAGLFLLVFAGDYLVKGSVGLAENLGISPLIIGLTIVAFGTSAPELFISVQAALDGAPGISVGNVVGSNIANVLLVIGLPALFAPLVATEPGILRNMVAMLLATVMFMIMIAGGVVSHLDGAILFGALIAFVVWQIRTARADKDAQGDYHDEIGEAPHDTLRIVLSIGGGIIGLPIAAQLTVAGAIGIAHTFGVSDAVIGLTIVAIGTSLPELATTMAAVWRKSSAVAIGNVVGSNLFNLLCIMGITGLIIPVQVPDRIIHVDMWVMLGTSLVLAFLAFARVNAGRCIGIAMLFAYAVYLVTVF